MKKIIKSRIFLVIITMIICISGTLYAASTYKATDVIYNASDGTSMNVNEALNDLYKKKNETDNSFFPFECKGDITLTNSFTTTITIETGNIDITKYKIVGGTTQVTNWDTTVNQQGLTTYTSSSIISCTNGITTVKITITNYTYAIYGTFKYSGAIYRT